MISEHTRSRILGTSQRRAAARKATLLLFTSAARVVLDVIALSRWENFDTGTMHDDAAARVAVINVPLHVSGPVQRHHETIHSLPELAMCEGCDHGLPMHGLTNFAVRWTFLTAEVCVAAAARAGHACGRVQLVSTSQALQLTEMARG